jgi:hypothetical protein
MAAAIHRCVAVRTSATSRSSGFFPPAGTPNAAASLSLASSPAVEPSNAVTSSPVPQLPDSSSASVRAASSSNAFRATCSPARWAPGFPARRVQAGHREYGAQDLVTALPGEQAAGDDSQQGVPSGQHPVRPVAVRRRGHRLPGHVPRQELLQQAPAVQALQFLQPQARAGRHPGGQPLPQPVPFLPGPSIGLNSGAGLAGTARAWQNGGTTGLLSGTVTRFRHLTSYQGLRCCFGLRNPHAAPRSYCGQVVTER